MAIQFIDDPSFASNLGRALGSGVIAGTQAYQNAREAKMKQDRELAAAHNFSQLLAGLGGGEGGMQNVNFAALTPDQMKFATDLKFRQVESEKKRDQAERHFQEKSTQQSWKNVEKDLGEARTDSQAAREESDGIYKMKALEKTGKLDSPAKAALLQKLGLDWMLSPESQAFNKQNAAFMAGAKKSVGADVSNYQLQAHMKRYPSLMTSKDGRQLVYDDILNTNALKEKYYKTMQKVIKDNGGKPPANLKLLTDERMQPTYDKYRQKYMDSIEKAAKIAPLAEEKEASSSDAAMDPAKYNGKVRQNEDGSYEISNGTSWVKVQPKTQQAQPAAPKVAAPVATSPNLPPVDFDTFLTDSYGTNYMEY